MSELISALFTHIQNVGKIISDFGIVDFLDVVVIAFIVYHAIKLIRETRAMQLIRSILVIFVVYFIANELNMISLKFLMKNVLDIGLITIVVLFQPELRRALETLGRSKITDIGVFGATGAAHDDAAASTAELIEVLAKSCEALSAKKTGALMVIEREIKLGEVINSGTIIDSKASPELIENIFFTNSPLHDGAMVIRSARLHAAGCFLPLSGNMEIGRELGTRHRAALGMSEVSDAVVVVVSEETGAISVALDSRLQRNLSVQNLRKLLSAKLNPDKGESAGGKIHLWEQVKQLKRHKKKKAEDEEADGR
ncbi:diadenylate cyclase CdaA [Ruminococcaceae bacterium OttesenSCG-928-L11]|nr:diadenylate cyclase CdaA [Ruminococcaceae bacterium OttesenSCG-928-L11]